MSEPLTSKDLVVGGFYNWKGQPERLSYIGAQRYNGDSRTWHQFALVDVPGVCWCEVLDWQLNLFEVTERAAVQAAQPEAVGEPVAWHVNHCGSCQIYTSLDSLDLTDCIVKPLYAAAPTEAKPAQQDAVDAEQIKKALNQAFVMGQSYWHDADSESYAANKRSDVTRQKFNEMRDELCAAISAKKGGA